MKRLLTALALSCVLVAATTARAGVITSGGAFVNDATSGIGGPGRTGPGANFNDGTAVVNGVTFTGSGTSGTLANGIGYALANVPNSFNPNFFDPSPAVTGSVTNLAHHFYYDGDTTETLTLSNLTVGHSYVLTQYDFAFGGPGGRIGNISDSQGGSLPRYDENGTPGNILQDAFSATTSSLVVSYGPYGGDSYHQYDLQVTDVTPAAVPEPASLTLLGLGVAGVLVRARRRRAA